MAGNAEKVRTEASVWLARLERGLQPEEGESLRDWLRHPAHRDAIVDAAKLWHGPDILAVLARLVPVGFGNPAPPQVKRIGPMKIAIGLCVAFIAIMPFVLSHRKMSGGLSAPSNPAQHPMPWGGSVYATRSGDTRRVTLVDGTQVTLNGQSRVSVLFGPIRLATLDYGEAIFHIAPEQRLFELTAGERHFATSAAMFDVRVIAPQSVELAVLDGAVTVRGLPWHWPSTPAQARLFDPKAFDDATVGPMESVSLEEALISRHSLTAQAANARLNWQPEEVLYISP